MIKEGKSAPEFALKDRNDEERALSQLADRYTVLFFYPKDNTPGCTLETVGFNKAAPKFKKLGASLVGISGGDAKSKTKFCNAHKLKIPLLSDTDFAVSKKFGVYGEKKFMGRTYMGIFRTTFVLDQNLKVVKVFDKVSPPEHPEEVLQFLKTL